MSAKPTFRSTVARLDECCSPVVRLDDLELMKMSGRSAPAACFILTAGHALGGMKTPNGASVKLMALILPLAGRDSSLLSGRKLALALPLERRPSKRLPERCDSLPSAGVNRPLWARLSSGDRLLYLLVGSGVPDAEPAASSDCKWGCNWWCSWVCLAANRKCGGFFACLDPDVSSLSVLWMMASRGLARDLACRDHIMPHTSQGR